MPGRKTKDAAVEGLSTYRSMRDFSKTAEPDGSVDAPPPDGKPRFVVQEHHATALHWDFRLEKDGVLVSWAVPKGIPPDPKVNHLAVHTEDHPLSYYDFEGDIPEGEYGGGKVILWDQGTYETEKFRDSEVMVTLHGKRLEGRYVLFQTDGKNWMMHRMDPPQDAEREPMPSEIVPMLAKPELDVPRNADAYGYEIKWDGVRAIAYVQGGRIRLQSRNRLDLTRSFPELAALGESLGAREVVLDGEVVCFDDQGRPSFELLQDRLNLSRPADVRRRMEDRPVFYMAFDLLYLDGRSTMALAYRDRRKLLEALELEGPSWRTPAYHEGNGAAFKEATKQRGLEGIIAKRLDSQYEPGRRTGCWLKIKNFRRQEFVVGGWTPGTGNREGTLGAILLGYYDRTPAEAAAAGVPQRLHFAGKVGTGFNDRTLKHILSELRQRKVDNSPFDVGVPEAGAQFVAPQLVADVEFLEWTQAGTLRAPSFKGLRPDKDARDVILESSEDGAPLQTELVARGASKRAKKPPRAETRAAEDVAAKVAEATPTPEPPPIEPAPSPDAAPAASAPQPRNGRTPASQPTVISVEGRQLSLSNLPKVLYPSGFTKAEVIDYYTRIAPVMLPHIEQRPMTLKRYPDGSMSKFFYEKECPSHRPPWVKTAGIHSGHKGRPINYCLVNDLPTLVWLANLASLELHPLLSRAPEVDRPTSVVFDLDPGAPANVVDCAEVAIRLRDLFAALGLQCAAKVSGSKGMQLYVPLNTPVTFDDTKAFSNAIARLLEREAPKKVTSSMNKALRVNKVFVDWSQNDSHKTTVSVYSLRAKERPYVSTPVTWDECEAAIAHRDAGALYFEAPTVLKRVEKVGDLFAPLVELKQALPAL